MAYHLLIMISNSSMTNWLMCIAPVVHLVHCMCLNQSLAYASDRFKICHTGLILVLVVHDCGPVVSITSVVNIFGGHILNDRHVSNYIAECIINLL